LVRHEEVIENVDFTELAYSELSGFESPPGLCYRHIYGVIEDSGRDASTE